ncbi:Uncharacterised protein [Chlamydia trachomatis]|nr:Uncharacterised protein [Chlamydia trachomatis]
MSFNSNSSTFQFSLSRVVWNNLGSDLVRDWAILVKLDLIESSCVVEFCKTNLVIISKTVLFDKSMKGNNLYDSLEGKVEMKTNIMKVLN